MMDYRFVQCLLQSSFLAAASYAIEPFGDTLLTTSEPICCLFYTKNSIRKKKQGVNLFMAVVCHHILIVKTYVTH